MALAIPEAFGLRSASKSRQSRTTGNLAAMDAISTHSGGLKNGYSGPNNPILWGGQLGRSAPDHCHRRSYYTSLEEADKRRDIGKPA